MKTTKYHLILAVLTTIITVPALAEVEPTDMLIGRPFPQLADIEQLYVFIVRPYVPPDIDALHFKNLEQSVMDKLKDARIKVAADNVDKTKPDSKRVLLRCIEEKDVRNLRLRYANIPELRIDIEIITLDDSQQYIFRIQTSLARTVALQARPNLHFRADVWKARPIMQTVSTKNINPAITKVVLKQVDAFIVDYLAANPPGSRPSDAEDISVKPQKPTKPDTKSAVAEYKYVASKNSKVFHKADCRWAERIKPANLVTYRSRKQATEAGKRPCKRCNP